MHPPMHSFVAFRVSLGKQFLSLFLAHSGVGITLLVLLGYMFCNCGGEVVSNKDGTFVTVAAMAVVNAEEGVSWLVCKIMRY